MKKNKSKKRKRKSIRKIIKEGVGFVDTLIDKLPFEVHVPSYQFCGPGDC